MEKITSKEQYINFYHYSLKYSPSRFPSQYPCFVKKERASDAMGEYIAHYVCYLPNNDKASNIEIFEAGLNTKWEFLE